MSESQQPQASQRFQVHLFVTCLADLFRPSVAFNSIALLEESGCDVTVPISQTCCGQPSYNTGDYEGTVPLAKRLIETFETADYVVAPSGSCVGMITHHYPNILEGQWRERALELAARTFELTQFLSEISGLKRANELRPEIGSVTYHDSCAGLRELGIQTQPRDLLNTLCKTDLKEMQRTDVCCGFGGTFCAKMPELSANMASDKLDTAQASGAKILAGGDLGCLMNLAGRAKREGMELEVRHIAELLAGDLATPAIGDSSQS
ncbi:MAG: (Fe-S)-binding protein [Halioglobus sp.]